MRGCMKKIIINKNLTQYQIIESMDRVTYYTSAFLYHTKEQGILIDTGYRRMGEFILEDLKKSGIKLKYIVVTHYHRDHAEGSTIFDNIPIIASIDYSDYFNKCCNSSAYVYNVPDILIESKSVFQLDTLIIEIFKTPGHTKCGLSVILNHEYLYVSDNLLEDIDNKIIVPYLDIDSDPIEHLELLSNYRDLLFKHLLLTHGPIKYKPNMEYELNERIFYLKKIIESDFNIDISDCLLRNIENYSMTSIHKINMRNAKKRRVSTANQDI